MIYTTEQIGRIVEPIAKRYGLPAVYLFGSYARGTATEDSDIDFLVDTTGTALKSLFALGGLYNDFEEAFDKQIDMNIIILWLQRQAQPSYVPGERHERSGENLCCLLTCKGSYTFWNTVRTCKQRLLGSALPLKISRPIRIIKSPSLLTFCKLEN